MARASDTPAQIDQDIKNGEFAGVYLLYGTESYLLRQYRDKLKAALLPVGDTMNFSYFEGKEVREGEIIDLAETLPFFADRRLIILENTEYFKTAHDALTDYIAGIPQTAVLVFVEKEVDKRGRLYKAVRDAGRAVEVTTPKEDLLIRWIGQRLKKEQKAMTREALRIFLNKTGMDMETIDKELEKLICYTLETPQIEAQHVEDICTGQATNQVFQMIEAFAKQQKKEALDLYYDLLALKEAPMRILYLIARQFRILWQIKEMQNRRLDQKTMAAKLGLAEFVVRKNMAQASHFEAAQLKEKVARCVELEEAVKTGKLNDKMAVELILCSE